MRTSVAKLACVNKVDDMIFVFGSNIRGIHGAGAAKFAVDHYGAVYGIGYGLQGQAFAVPTKDENIETLPLHAVHNYVLHFMSDARRLNHLRFRVTRVGCGLAGFVDEQIAPLFVGAPINCHFYEEWKPWLPHTACDLGPSPR